MSITLFPKKLSTQSMGLSSEVLESVASQCKGKAIPVLRVWGIVSTATPGASQYGPFIKFGGEIAGMNLITGEEARSQTLLLPGVAEGIVKSLFDKAAADGGAAQIGIEISVEENTSTKGGLKYKYVVKPLFEYIGDDALSVMAKSLPAPKLFKALTDTTTTPKPSKK
jgi:hypothetical protein